MKALVIDCGIYRLGCNSKPSGISTPPRWENTVKGTAIVVGDLVEGDEGQPDRRTLTCDDGSLFHATQQAAILGEIAKRLKLPPMEGLPDN